MDVRFRPYTWIGERTPPGKKRSRYTFKAGWNDTLNKLEDELIKLKASEIIIEAGFSESDIRLDGWPRANSNPSYSGVKVSFNIPGLGRVEYATDVCEMWQHNVRSIALGLEALRAVDRYGITQGKQQYTGFKAIASSNGAMSRRDAAEWIADLIHHRDLEHGDWARAVQALIDKRPENVPHIIRRATLKVHPDQNGGDRGHWDRFEKAKEVLGV